MKRTVVFNFHTRNDKGVPLLGFAVELIKYHSDRPILDLQKEAFDYMMKIASGYPNGLMMTIEVFE